MRSEFISLVSRLTILISSLAVVWLNTAYLGTEGQGSAALLSFGILLVVTMSQFIGGGALVFLASRMKTGVTFLPSMMWAAISACFFYGVFRLIDIVPEELVKHACILGLLQSVFSWCMQLMLARQRTETYNYTVMLQVVVVPIVLAASYFSGQVNSDLPILVFVRALYISFALTSVVCLVHVRSEISWKLDDWRQSFSEMFRLGKFAQSGNIFHLLNQRLNYAFIENMVQAARYQTGLLSLAMYAAEALWTVSKSFSVVQYARTAAMKDKREQIVLLNRNSRMVAILIIPALVLLFFIPDVFYSWILHTSAKGLRTVILCLLPGILANSFSILYSSWFSGNGLHRHNMWASGCGLAIGLVMSITLIPEHEAVGAAVSASAALSAQLIYFLLAFRKLGRKMLNEVNEGL